VFSELSDVARVGVQEGLAKGPIRGNGLPTRGHRLQHHLVATEAEVTSGLFTADRRDVEQAICLSGVLPRREGATYSDGDGTARFGLGAAGLRKRAEDRRLLPQGSSKPAANSPPDPLVSWS
jgi:hypothetical protein